MQRPYSNQLEDYFFDKEMKQWGLTESNPVPNPNIVDVESR